MNSSQSNNNTRPVALVTGASGDIGRAIAVRLARSGYDIAVHYNSDQSGAHKTTDEIKKYGGRALLLSADISSYDAAERMVDDCRICLGRIDLLVNNAGIADIRTFSDTTPENWRRVQSVDLDGTYNCCSCVLKYLSNGSSIINISSVWGIYGASCEVAYSAAKSGVIGLTQALAKELGPSGIRVNCVAPGTIDSRMNDWLGSDGINDIIDRTPLCRLGTPEDVANAVNFLASEQASFITGVTLPVTGGFC